MGFVLNKEFLSFRVFNESFIKNRDCDKILRQNIAAKFGAVFFPWLERQMFLECAFYELRESQKRKRIIS